MSTNPPNFRLPSNIRGLVPDQVADTIEDHDDRIVDLQQAIPVLKNQIEALKPGASSTSTTENVTNNSETVISATNVIGSVNNQTGVTAYATAQSDYGAFILLSDASAIAVTLTAAPVITLPWFATLINLGAGTATLTPASGLINGGASFSLLSNSVVTVVFDGTNFEIAPLLALPVNTPGVSHEWIASYNATTGVFSLLQPAFTDISGTATAGQVPALSALSGQITTSQLPSSGLSVTITTAKLTGGGSNGSMTFTNGILTAQTPAT